MGAGFNLECKKCGFSSSASLGIGMLYPMVCDKILQKMKKGEFGEKFKEAANTIPNPAIHQSNALFVCDNCGSWRVDEIIDLCSPIKKTQKKKSSEENESTKLHSYVMDIGDTHQIVHSVEQKCTCCEENMRAMEKFKIDKLKLKCPQCNEHMIISGVYRWD